MIDPWILVAASGWVCALVTFVCLTITIRSLSIVSEALDNALEILTGDKQDD